MRLIDNNVYEYVQEPGIDGIYKAVRDAAYICYQTDIEKAKMAPKEFVENVLLKNGHTRPLEFGTVYLKVPSVNKETELVDRLESNLKFIGKYLKNPYSKVFNTTILGLDGFAYITTNLRVIMQGNYSSDEQAWKNGYDKNWLDDLKYLCDEQSTFFYRRRTFDLTLSRGASDDLRTHISLSSMCESTRFCNYSKGKYGNQLTGIKPYWIDFGTPEDVTFSANNATSTDMGLPENELNFIKSMEREEIEYLSNAEYGLQPQQLKRLFPLWAKCELRLCGFENAWDNFMWRRLDGHADPECTKIAEMVQKIRKP